MASSIETFSFDPDKHPELERKFQQLKASRVFSDWILQAATEKLQRAVGQEPTDELVRKIWDRLKDMDALPAGIEVVEDDDDLAHLRGALDALSGFD